MLDSSVYYDRLINALSDRFNYAINLGNHTSAYYALFDKFRHVADFDFTYKRTLVVRVEKQSTDGRKRTASRQGTREAVQ